MLLHMVTQAYRNKVIQVKSGHPGSMACLGCPRTLLRARMQKGVSIAATVSCQFRLGLIQAIIENALCEKICVTADWTLLWGLLDFLQPSSTFWDIQIHYTVSRTLAHASRRASYL